MFSVLLVIIGFSAVLWDYIYDPYRYCDRTIAVLWNPSVFIFCFSVSLGIVSLAYGFKPVLDIAKTLIGGNRELSKTNMDECIAFVDYAIKVSSNVGRLCLILAFIDGMSQDLAAIMSDFKMGFILYIMTGYLYVFCAIYIVYDPIRRILEEKRKMLDIAAADATNAVVMSSGQMQEEWDEEQDNRSGMTGYFKKVGIYPKIIGLAIVAFSCFVFVFRLPYVQIFTNRIDWHLYTIYSFVFAFGCSFGMLLCVYGFKQIKGTASAIFKKDCALTEEQLEQHISLIDFAVTISMGIGRIGVIFVFIDAFGALVVWPSADNDTQYMNMHFLFDGLVAYLYLTIAVYFIYLPSRKKLCLKLEALRMNDPVLEL